MMHIPLFSLKKRKWTFSFWNEISKMADFSYRTCSDTPGQTSPIFLDRVAGQVDPHAGCTATANTKRFLAWITV